TVSVAEFFYKEFEEKELLLLLNGQTVLADEIDQDALTLEGISVLQRRKTKLPTVHHVKMTGSEVLERTIWPGRWIPIIPIYGDELVIEGKRHLEGLI